MILSYKSYKPINTILPPHAKKRYQNFSMFSLPVIVSCKLHEPREYHCISKLGVTFWYLVIHKQINQVDGTTSLYIKKKREKKRNSCKDKREDNWSKTCIIQILYNHLLEGKQNIHILINSVVCILFGKQCEALKIRPHN